MKNNEQGRSMIEMLGVLAIIGVLSVGGLAGYAKAMGKYRVNKTIDQVANTVANTRVLFGSQRTYEDLNGGSAATIIQKAKMLPDTLKQADENGSANGDTKYTNAYSGNFYIKAGGRFTTTDNRAFVLVFTGIPQDACIDLATQDWNASAGSGLLAMGIEATTSPTATANLATGFQASANVLSGNCSAQQTAGSSDFWVYCAEGATDPVTLADATAACTGNTAANNMATLYFKFY